MALFSFKKKKTDEPQPFEFSQQAASPAPVEEAQRLRQQGYNNNQIAQYLQTRGYTQQQVSDAITQASLAGFQQPGYAQEFPQQNPYQQYQQFQQQPQPQQQQQEGASANDERIEEIAEAIIDEKWQELVKDVKKVIEWKDVVESRLDHLDQQIKDIKGSMETMQRGIFGKIQDYDKSINDVGTEIKAMEKVFQKVLPSLTESVNRLDRMSKAGKK